MASSLARDSNQNNAMNVVNIEDDDGRQKKGCCKWFMGYYNIDDYDNILI